MKPVYFENLLLLMPEAFIELVGRLNSHHLTTLFILYDAYQFVRTLLVFLNLETPQDCHSCGTKELIITEPFYNYYIATIVLISFNCLTRWVIFSICVAIFFIANTLYRSNDLITRYPTFRSILVMPFYAILESTDEKENVIKNIGLFNKYVSRLTLIPIVLMYLVLFSSSRLLYTKYWAFCCSSYDDMDYDCILGEAAEDVCSKLKDFKYERVYFHEDPNFLFLLACYFVVFFEFIIETILYLTKKSTS